MSLTSGDDTVKSLLTFLVACLSTLAVAQPAITQQEKHSPTTSRNPFVDSIVVCAPRSYGWNMVSNPVLRAPGTDSVWQVLCDARRWCFPFWPPGGGWAQSCIAQNGRGFWVKVLPPGSTACCIVGDAIAQDSIPVTNGWNLIGTISYPVAASSVYSIPSNIIVSGFFGFSSGYVRVDTLRPGLAYWVKSQQAGRLVLSSGL